MAVDTAQKRFSMMGVGYHPILVNIPQGAVQASERALLLDLYSGIALDSPVVLNRLQKDWDYETGHSRTIKVSTRTDNLKVKIGDE